MLLCLWTLRLILLQLASDYERSAAQLFCMAGDFLGTGDTLQCLRWSTGGDRDIHLEAVTNLEERYTSANLTTSEDQN